MMASIIFIKILILIIYLVGVGCLLDSFWVMPSRDKWGVVHLSKSSIDVSPLTLSARIENSPCSHYDQINVNMCVHTQTHGLVSFTIRMNSTIQ